MPGRGYQSGGRPPGWLEGEPHRLKSNVTRRAALCQRRYSGTDAPTMRSGAKPQHSAIEAA